MRAIRNSARDRIGPWQRSNGIGQADILRGRRHLRRLWLRTLHVATRDRATRRTCGEAVATTSCEGIL